MTNRYNTEETVKDILDVATKLFVEKGYEKTSISDIVNGLNGLTRGAIYHHFESKDAIIEAVMQRFAPNPSAFEAIDRRTDLNGLEKMQEMLIEMIANEEMIAAVKIGFSMLNNPKFFVIYMQYVAQVLPPHFEKYIIEGNQDGSLDVPYPKEISEIIILITSTWFLRALFPDSEETAMEKVNAAAYVLKSIGVDLWDDDLLERLRDRVRRNEDLNGNNN